MRGDFDEDELDDADVIGDVVESLQANLKAAEALLETQRLERETRDSQLGTLLRELCPAVTPYPSMNEARDRIKALEAVEALLETRTQELETAREAIEDRKEDARLAAETIGYVGSQLFEARSLLETSTQELAIVQLNLTSILACDEGNRAEHARDRAALDAAEAKLARLIQQGAQLKAVVEQIRENAAYALTTSGQRTRPPRFVPSAAKWLLELCDAALLADPLRSQP